VHTTRKEIRRKVTKNFQGSKSNADFSSVSGVITTGFWLVASRLRASVRELSELMGDSDAADRESDQFSEVDMKVWYRLLNRR
jgi:hypothetical protein